MSWKSTISNFSDEELINVIIDYADEHDNFDPEYAHNMEAAIEEYGELTHAQREGLENIVTKFRMI